MVALTDRIRRRAEVTAAALGRFGAVRATYVFGSQAEDTAGEWSDIDLAAFMEGVESWNLWERARIIAEVQKEAGYDIEPHLFPARSLANPQPGSFAEYVIEHGVRVDGP
jgi:predicted nucleotidyltransferase